MNDDNRLSRTNEKKLLMTNKNIKKNCVVHFNGLVTAASTEYLFHLCLIHFNLEKKLTLMVLIEIILN